MSDSLSQAKVRAVLQAMRKKNPSALRGVKVRMDGRSGLVDDLFWRRNPPNPKTASWKDKLGGRVWHNPRTTLLGKTAGSVATVFSSPLDLLKVSRYNPASDAVQLYSDDKAVVQHELGRAVDVNSSPTPLKRDLYTTLIQPPVLPMEVRLLHLPVKFATEMAADARAWKDKRKKKPSPRSLAAMSPERVKVLAGTLGAYGGSALGPASYFLPPHLSLPLALTTGLVGSGLGALGGQRLASSVLRARGRSS